MNNLIIAPCGNDNSLIKQWVEGKPDFDLVLLYYGDSEEMAKSYKQYTPHVYMGKGEKYHLIHSFHLNNPGFIEQYDYVWLPDDDVLIYTEEINKLFNIADNYKLDLCQPSMVGFVSHHITRPIDNCILRYTNFVEVLAPLFSKQTFLKLVPEFNLNKSAWGYDYLWPYLLRFPQDKIAIIDDIVMNHTKPVGSSYGDRFPKPPHEDLRDILQKYNIRKEEIEYSRISK